MGQTRGRAVSGERYSLCGIALEVSGSELSAELLAFIEDVFLFGRAEESDPHASVLSLRLGQNVEIAPDGSELVYQAMPLAVYRTTTGFFLRCGDSCLNLNVGRGEATGAVNRRFWHEPMESRRGFFLLALLLLLRPHALYGLHASGVSRNGRGLLFVGDSGCGKTTLTLACMRAGWCYISDDVLVLCRDEEGIAASAFRKGFSCDRELVQRFPELTLEAAATVAGGRKRQFSPDLVFPDRLAGRSIVGGICFPQVSSEPRTRMVSISETSAVVGMIRQSPGILTERESSRVQLDTLRQLAEQARAYKLVLGTDVFEDHPEQVSCMLAKACEAV